MTVVLTRRAAAPALHSFVEDLRAIAPPVGSDRFLGPELGRLAADFGARIFAAD